MDRQVEPDSVDVHVMSWVLAHRRQHPAVTSVYRAVTTLGNLDVGLAMIVLSAVVFYAWHRRGMPGIGRWDWLFFVWVSVGSRLMSTAMKEIYRRPRPPSVSMLVRELSYSFPSGHSLSSAAFFTAWVALFWRAAADEPRWVRGAWLAIAVGMTLAIASSRVWLTVHYATDVVGGLLVGWAWGLACCAIHLGWRVSWRRRRGDLTSVPAPR